MAEAEPDPVSGMFAGAPGVELKVTLCVMAKFQVTNPPTAMSTVLGENVRPAVAFTVALDGYTTAVTVTTVAADATVTPPAVADTVMLVVPAATPVTSPELLMVAVPGTEEFHTRVAAIALPYWSFGLAVNCNVPFTAMEFDTAVMVTLVSTGGGGVIVITTVFVTVTPPAVALAVIVALPAATPVTRPVVLPTLAMVDADELQVTVAANAAPFWSFVAAVS